MNTLTHFFAIDVTAGFEYSSDRIWASGHTKFCSESGRSPMDLKDAILLIPPREQSGSEMADRVAYQIDWVLSKIIELHRTDDDYLIVLEHQDDVILLDSEASP